MAVPEIDRWLADLGLSELAKVFAEHGIDLEILPSISEEDLKEIGVVLGHRRKLLNAISSLPLDDRADRDAPQVTRPERRQLTVLFCDLVGSTQMSDTSDPEAFREAILAYQSAVAGAIRSHRGYVAKYLGDGILAYFGYPVSSEDDATNALRAAISILQELKGLAGPDGSPVSTRIGVATGMVVVGDIVGDDIQEVASIAGSTPNVAHRLQTAAKPNEVLLSHATREIVGDFFEVERIDDIELKGLRDRQTAWRLIQENVVTNRFEAIRRAQLSTFVGRASELQFLEERWKAAEDGEGQAIGLIGEAGIGKSRLVSEFLSQNRISSVERYFCQCSPMHTQQANFPFAQMMRGVVGIAQELGAFDQHKRLQQWLAGVGYSNQQSQAILAAMLSLPPCEEFPRTQIAAERLGELTRSLVIGVLSKLSRRNPLLLICEDWHWVDPTSASLLSGFIEKLGDLPVLVIATSRNENHLGWTELSNYSKLHLSRMTRRHVDEIVNSVTNNWNMQSEVVQSIAERSDGIPLHVEELTRAYLERQSNQSSVLTKSTDVPLTLHDSILARLDQLGSAKEVAQIASVIGRRFQKQLLYAIADDAEVVDDALLKLCESGLAYGLASEDGSYEFKHALIRDAAFGTLLLSTRQQLHRRIAETLEGQLTEGASVDGLVMAEHYFSAQSWEKACAYFSRAGDAAARTSANLEAASNYARAIEAAENLDRSSQAINLQLKKGRVLSIVGQREEALACFSAAKDLAVELGDKEALANVLSNRSRLHYYDGEFELAEEVGHHALELIEGSPDLSRVAAACLNLGLVRFSTRGPAEALKLFERALKLRRELSDHRGEMAALTYLASAHTRAGNFQLAFDAAHEAFERAERLGDMRMSLWCQIYLSEAHVYAGNEEQSNHHGRLAEQLNETVQDDRAEAWIYGVPTNIHLDKESYEEFIQYLEEEVRKPQFLFYRHEACYRQARLAFCYAALGREQEAQDWLSKPFSMDELKAVPLEYGWAKLADGLLTKSKLGQHGDEGLLVCFLEAKQTFERAGARHDTARASLILAEQIWALDRDVARQHLAAAKEEFSRNGNSILLKRARELA